MNGIILLNSQVYTGNAKGETKLLRDAGNLLHFAQEQQIELVKLNPDQLHIYYTIPFALHYDLKKWNATFDYLLIHSTSHFKKFREDYGEYWKAIKNHFTFVAEAETHLQLEFNLFTDEVQDLPPISNL